MIPPPFIETKRLLLRPPVREDAQLVFSAYAQDPEVTKYLIWLPHKDIQETEQFMAACIAEWEGSERFPYVITLRQGGELVGMMELRIDRFKAEFGYVLSRPHWGKGLMTEALGALVNWAVAQRGIHRLWALCDVENVASARVLEKVGLQREGVMRRQTIHPLLSNEPRDCYCYTLVK